MGLREEMTQSQLEDKVREEISKFVYTRIAKHLDSIEYHSKMARAFEAQQEKLGLRW